MLETVHLVDASPYIFRAYYSLPSGLRDSAGRRTGAVYGFAGFLLRLLESERPSHLAICFDGSLTTSFRNALYPEYKAHREPPPAELEAQMGDCLEMARALGAATFIDNAFEADDLIATLVESLVGAGWNAVVVTSDKDLCQLVSERVTLLDFAREIHLGAPEVREKLGVRPDQVADFLGLAGDAVDNIPGVRGVGARTAATLLGRWNHLEDLFEDLDQVADLPMRGASSVRDKLAEGRESALLSKALASLVRDVSLEVRGEDLAWKGPVADRIEAICRRLGFDGLPGRLKKLHSGGGSPP